jgi:hypothetical protein
MYLSEIKLGDFITLRDDSGYGEAYRSGHVRKVTPSGVMLAFGLKTTPEVDRLQWAFDLPVAWNHIASIERKYPVTKHSTFTHNGRNCSVTSHEYEWRKIA